MAIEALLNMAIGQTDGEKSAGVVANFLRRTVSSIAREFSTAFQA